MVLIINKFRELLKWQNKGKVTVTAVKLKKLIKTDFKCRKIIVLI